MTRIRDAIAALTTWLAMAVPLAAQQPGAVSTELPPVRLRAAVAELSSTANGVRGDDVSGDETVADCARFRLRLRDVRAYFARAQAVGARAYHHDLEMSRCHARGRVTFSDGRRGRWWIDRERRGRVLLRGGQQFLLHCPSCATRAFEPVYDPEREG